MSLTPIISSQSAFRSVPGVNLADCDYFDPTHHAYSRWTQGVSTRVEKVLGKILVSSTIVISGPLSGSQKLECTEMWFKRTVT